VSARPAPAPILPCAAMTGLRRADTGTGEKLFCAGADIAMLEKANPYFKYDGAL